MVKKPKLEHIVERNRVLAFSGPIPIELAQRHFYALSDYVHATGKTVTFLIRGEVAGCLQPVPEKVEAAWG